jgi:starch phosphorylase
MIASTAGQHGGHLSAYDRASRAVAYFSMEIAVQDGVPTYSGGLGVLAGDHLRSAADLGLPLVGVTLLYRRGYFSQRLDDDGRQSEDTPLGAADRYPKLSRFLEG